MKPKTTPYWYNFGFDAGFANHQSRANSIKKVQSRNLYEAGYKAGQEYKRKLDKDFANGEFN